MVSRASTAGRNRASDDFCSISGCKLFYFINIFGLLLIGATIAFIAIPFKFYHHEPIVWTVDLNLTSGTISYAIKMNIHEISENSTGLYFTTHNAGYQLGTVKFGNISVSVPFGCIGRAVAAQSFSKKLLPPRHVTIVDVYADAFTFSKFRLLEKKTPSSPDSQQQQDPNEANYVLYDTVLYQIPSVKKTPVNVNVAQLLNEVPTNVHALEYVLDNGNVVFEFVAGPRVEFGTIQLGNFKSTPTRDVLDRSIAIETCATLPISRVSIKSLKRDGTTEMLQFYGPSELAKGPFVQEQDFAKLLSSLKLEAQSIEQLFRGQVFRYSDMTFVPLSISEHPTNVVFLEVFNEHHMYLFCFASLPFQIGSVEMTRDVVIPQEDNSLDRILWFIYDLNHTVLDRCYLFTRLETGIDVVPYQFKSNAWERVDFTESHGFF
ncbi:hypothetical protein BdWA1_001412 [Babesia duncani]|uniref:Uncharacterized protein n=1 Tax=Babesia duncani TaxID=323732 RepID=A0AAD9UR10_9APIC|nr:hypothetical protein BdWA1_001412 [Babesia duncani]